MGDRELLEKAAKAAGYQIKWGEVFELAGDPIDCSDLCYIVDEEGDLTPWAPLEDDGDALRLAVKLRIGVVHNDPRDQEPYVMADCARLVGRAFESFTVTEAVKDESVREAATRRAIVRAAAALEEPHHEG